MGTTLPAYGIIYHRQQPQSYYCSIDHNQNMSTEYCYYSHQGPVIILMPNLGKSMAVWSSGFIDALHRQHAVLIYNRMGYGHSQLMVKTRRRSAKIVSIQLYQLIQHLHPKQGVYLLAYGGAAYYAQIFMQQHPELIRGLILVNPVSLHQPQRDYQLYKRFLPAARSIGYYEYLGMVSRKNMRTAKNKAIYIVSSDAEHSAASRQRLWKQQQQKFIKLYPTVKLSYAKSVLYEHQEANHQAALLKIITDIKN
jgi:pimeloyl-ACP methyl ester carboxylesterase